MVPNQVNNYQMVHFSKTFVMAEKQNNSNVTQLFLKLINYSV